MVSIFQQLQPVTPCLSIGTIAGGIGRERRPDADLLGERFPGFAVIAFQDLPLTYFLHSYRLHTYLTPRWQARMARFTEGASLCVEGGGWRGGWDESCGGSRWLPTGPKLCEAQITQVLQKEGLVPVSLKCRLPPGDPSSEH
jgi:hypothetical protein